MKNKQRLVLYAALDFTLRQGNTLDGFLCIFHSARPLDILICKMLTDNGVTEEMVLGSKDILVGHTQTLERVKKGEYFTPTLWVHEALTYFDKHIPNWKEDYYIWDAAAGTGNLLDALDVPKERIFASTLEPVDVAVLQRKGYTACALDFLNGVNHDADNMFFEQLLPDELVAVLKADKPLIFFMNPPYKDGRSGENDVSNLMLANNLGNAAKELYYQFLFRIVELIETYNLTNVYVGVFGLLTYHVGVALQAFSGYLDNYLNVLDGMLMPSDEFLDTSASLRWSIGFTLMTRGVRDKLLPVVYDVKDLNSKGVIECIAREEFIFGRQFLAKWVLPADVFEFGYRQASANPPILLQDIGERYAEGALGVLTLSDRVGTAGQRTVVSTVPLTFASNIPVTKENLYRCAVAFTAQHLIKDNWAQFIKRYYAPKLGELTASELDEYNEWANNALIYFLTHSKSRGISLGEGAGCLSAISNTLFPFTYAMVDKAVRHVIVSPDTRFSSTTGWSVAMLEALGNGAESESYIAHLVAGLRGRLWPESEAVLDAYLAIVCNAEYRGGESNMLWDAGLVQLKPFMPRDVYQAYTLLVKGLGVRLGQSIERYAFI